MRQVANNQRGVSVIEVLVSLSMAGLIIASVGNLLTGISRTTRTGGQREQALAYAKQALEVVNDIKDNRFACDCKPGGPDAPCTNPNTCTPVADASQSCTLASGYTTCWVPRPLGETGSVFSLSDVSGFWDLVATANPDGETIGTTNYRWKLEFVSVGGDSNVKRVTATVSWSDQGTTKNVQLATMITAWKNL